MKNFKSLGFYAALILVLLLIVTLLFSGTGEKRIKYSQVLDHFENKEVYYFEINDNILDVQLLSGEKYSSIALKLGISEKAVDNSLARIRKKLKNK